MKLRLMMALGLLTLSASSPLLMGAAEATGPCILYPWSYRVGGYYVYTPGATIPGQDIYFIHTDDVRITPGSVYVPYVTTVNTPGICYGPVQDFVDQLLAGIRLTA